MHLRLMFASLLGCATACAQPARVIVCTFTAGYRHSSIPHGEKALQEIAAATKAFTIADWVREVPAAQPQKPTPPKAPAPSATEAQKKQYDEKLKTFEQQLAKWTPEQEALAQKATTEREKAVAGEMAKLHPDFLREKQIDAVIFCNTTGDLPLPDVEGLMRWVEEGHAFIGMHAASDTLKQSRPYMEMLQGCFNGHGPQTPAELSAGDCDHPANGQIGQSWKLAQEEIYRISKHDRSKVRALWFLRYNVLKPDEKGYYPVSWARVAGKGRVFYTTLGHREDLWDNSSNLPSRINPVETSNQYRAHITGGILWALGLAAGSAEPNPEVN